MWLFKWPDNAVSTRENRRIVITEITKDVQKTAYLYEEKTLAEQGYRRPSFCTFYTLIEELHTASDSYRFSNRDHFYFYDFEQAAAFLCDLVYKLNSDTCNYLIDETTRIAAIVIESHKGDVRKQRKIDCEDKSLRAEIRDIIKSVREEIKLEEQEKEHRKKVLEKKRVYIFDMGDGTVKIGISQNVGSRRGAIIGSSGRDIKRYCYTEFFLTRRALQIEANCHMHFDQYRQRGKTGNYLGEFFQISYEQAKTYLESIAQIENEVVNY